VQKSNLCQGKCDTLDKIHKQICHTAVETHRAKEMTEAILRILEKLGETTKTLSIWPIDDSIKTLEKVKKKLDASLADDISQGRYYSQGHIGNFRMPENFLIKFRNQWNLLHCYCCEATKTVADGHINCIIKKNWKFKEDIRPIFAEHITITR